MWKRLEPPSSTNQPVTMFSARVPVQLVLNPTPYNQLANDGEYTSHFAIQVTQSHCDSSNCSLSALMNLQFTSTSQICKRPLVLFSIYSTHYRHSFTDTASTHEIRSVNLILSLALQHVVYFPSSRSPCPLMPMHATATANPAPLISPQKSD
jgi:hypothetical protein